MSLLTQDDWSLVTKRGIKQSVPNFMRVAKNMNQENQPVLTQLYEVSYFSQYQLVQRAITAKIFKVEDLNTDWKQTTWSIRRLKKSIMYTVSIKLPLLNEVLIYFWRYNLTRRRTAINIKVKFTYEEKCYKGTPSNLNSKVLLTLARL